jgi:hypothetical protein
MSELEAEFKLRLDSTVAEGVYCLQQPVSTGVYAKEIIRDC